MKKIYFLFLLIFSLNSFSSPHVSVGLFRNFDTIQDEDGLETKDPFYAMVQIGYNFAPIFGFIFSPQFIFATTSNNSNDEYGGDYSTKTYGFLYDFLYPFGTGMAFRFGIGNIIKSTSGDGGVVTIPNGTGTATAYKPEDSKSYTGTLNLGFETVFTSSLFILTHTGLRLEYLISSPFKGTRRSGYLTFSVQGYF